MKRHLGSAIFLLAATVGLIAQARPTQNGSGGSTAPGTTSGSADPFSMHDLQQPVYMSGKVILAGGGTTTEPVAIQTVCSDRKRMETHTDSQGNFSFEVKTRPELMGQQTADLSNFGGGTFSKNTGGSWRDCELQAILVGFTSEPVPFSRVMSTFQTTDFGKITLRPIGNGEGSVLSVTSLAAPDAAKKAMEKARNQGKKTSPTRPGSLWKKRFRSILNMPLPGPN